MDILKEILKELSPLLKEFDFVKKGNDFYKVSEKNYGIVNFQKSLDSTKEGIKFTVNFGVYSGILGELLGGYNNVIKPRVYDCQWQARVGTFMHGSPDYWWFVKISDNIDGVISELKEAVQNIIVPELNKRLSDEDLIKSWINEKHAGTSAAGRFIYLTTLLKAKGDFNTLNQVIETFMKESEGKPDATRAKEHLKEIGYSN